MQKSSHGDRRRGILSGPCSDWAQRGGALAPVTFFCGGFDYGKSPFLMGKLTITMERSTNKNAELGSKNAEFSNKKCVLTKKTCVNCKWSWNQDDCELRNIMVIWCDLWSSIYGCHWFSLAKCFDSIALTRPNEVLWVGPITGLLGKHTKKTRENHHVSRVYHDTIWPCSIVFCMFTRG